MEVEPLFCGKEAFLERSPEEGRISEKGDVFVGFALTECGGDRNEAEKKMFRVEKRSEVWRREGAERWKELRSITVLMACCPWRKTAGWPWYLDSWSQRGVVTDLVLERAKRVER